MEKFFKTLGKILVYVIYVIVIIIIIGIIRWIIKAFFNKTD